MYASITLAALATLAAGEPVAHFPPDPVSVRRLDKAYTYPQAGWTVLHVEGEPYARGYQHGRLLAREIGEFVMAVAKEQSSKAPADAWRLTRALVDANFLRGFDPEYLDEMKGIADGASDAGARFDGRPIDVIDVAVINCWPEVFTLGGGLSAWPTGMESRRFPRELSCCPPIEADHCSAFAATGPATADGKIVFGHITMFGLYESRWFNVWLDVQPAKGHRVVMQTFPGGIQSGMDYYLSSAGMMVTETTIKQTRFDPKGVPLASRIRKALQYGSSIDEVVDILSKSNNGLYTNEWLLGDAKTNEIAMFELGTHKTRLWRSGRGEWFGGTEGFYWGCNNTKDMQVRLESYPGTDGRPVNAVWRPGERDKAWLKFYQGHKGKIGPDFARLVYSSPPIASYSSLDAKFTTTELAKDLKSWALFGPPLGRTWVPDRSDFARHDDVRPLVSNPWTLLTAEAPPVIKDVAQARDLADKIDPFAVAPRPLPESTAPAWFGTLLPKADGDAWLAAAFADYERIVALENAWRREEGGKLTPAMRQRLAVELNAHRVGYRAAALADRDQPVTGVTVNGSDEWYRIAAGKGVLALHELRGLLGGEKFALLMEKFGRSHAGQAVATTDFMEFITREGGQSTNGFFDFWLNQPGLPSLSFGSQPPKAVLSGGYHVAGTLVRPAGLPKGRVELTVETDTDEVTQVVELNGDATAFRVEVPRKPRRLVVDKYGWAIGPARSAFGLQSWAGEVARTLIVYGTADDEAANREAAEALRQLIRARRNNHTLRVVADRDAAPDDLKSHHLLVVGRPATNTVAARCAESWPVSFGRNSARVRGGTYAHPGTVVLAAGPNPFASRFSAVAVVGLGADATTHAPEVLVRQAPAGADVAVVPHAGQLDAFVAPDPALTVEFARD
jgi:hypothetical protein